MIPIWGWFGDAEVVYWKAAGRNPMFGELRRSSQRPLGEISKVYDHSFGYESVCRRSKKLACQYKKVQTNKPMNVPFVADTDSWTRPSIVRPPNSSL